MSDHGLNKMDMPQDERVETIKRSEAHDREGIGEPGVESASGRDRSQGELPRQAGTNVNDVDISGVVPQQHGQGSRTGEQGDPTGA